jgi:hypothetical protein
MNGKLLFDSLELRREENKQRQKKMKLTNAITTTLLIAASLVSNALPSQASGASLETEINYISAMLKNEHVSCHVSAIVLTSARRLDANYDGIYKFYVYEAEKLAINRCESPRELKYEMTNANKNSVYKQVKVQIFVVETLFANFLRASLQK